MTTIRWTAIVLATVTVAALYFTPVSLASVILAGIFMAAFLVACWTFREALPAPTAAGELAAKWEPMDWAVGSDAQTARRVPTRGRR